MPEGELVVVRSSALDEDSVQHSFAGQLDSYLFVSAADVMKRVMDVWRSGFSERVLAYREEHGLPLLPSAPAVLVQRMIDSDVSGVAFAVDPVTGQHANAVIGAVYGVGTALVSGEADADTYHVDITGSIVNREVADKRIKHRMDTTSHEGVSAEPVPSDQSNIPAINDNQIRAVAELVRGTSHFAGRPQDIEWAIAGNELYLLQSRPITSLASIADPDGVLNLTTENRSR